MSQIQEFSQRVEDKANYGVGWIEIATILIPIIIDCFKKSDDVERAAKSPTALQRVGLRLRVRKELQQSNKLKGKKLRDAVEDLTNAVLAQAKEDVESELLQGDVWANIIDEAKTLAG